MSSYSSGFSAREGSGGRTPSSPSMRASQRATTQSAPREKNAQPDGSVNTVVAETAIDMDAVAAQLWVNEAKKAVGLSVPKVYSKIKIKMAIANLGYLPALESWLASAEVAPGYSALAAWNDANVISDDFPGFETYYAAALAKFGITREQGDAILSQCIAD